MIVGLLKIVYLVVCLRRLDGCLGISSGLLGGILSDDEWLFVLVGALRFVRGISLLPKPNVCCSDKGCSSAAELLLLRLPKFPAADEDEEVSCEPLGDSSSHVV